LERLGYQGVVFVPEAEDGEWQHNYDAQIEWEDRGLNFADVNLFWVPRELEHMPAFTTNIEWGYWTARDPSRLVLGSPASAPKMKYLEYYAQKLGVPISTDLESACEVALEKIGAGALRTAGEREVPLHVWNAPSFQTWYEYLKTAGNRLDGARALWVFSTGPKRVPFAYALHANVYVASEGRNKLNEFMLTRSDISSVVLYSGGHGPKARVVLVQEFRTPVSNPMGMVTELPGGSSWKPGEDPRMVAAHECEEEVGIRIAPERFTHVATKQLAATFSSHRAHLFAAMLSHDEMDAIEHRPRVARGVEGSSERTYTIVRRYYELLDDETIDWSTLGMISKALSN
jgi:8-oxo-dGTP pyrophosphatase MutT (NUDIX family)